MNSIVTAGQTLFFLFCRCATEGSSLLVYLTSLFELADFKAMATCRRGDIFKHGFQLLLAQIEFDGYIRRRPAQRTTCSTNELPMPRRACIGALRSLLSPYQSQATAQYCIQMESLLMLCTTLKT